MFREMRRKGQRLEKDECERILNETTCGVLAVSGDDGYPYAVPVNHVYKDGFIYFHCAKTGHKIDAIRNNDKVSFCAVYKSDVVAEKRATAYISVIAFGRAKTVEDEQKQREICRLLAEKFCPDDMEGAKQETEETIAHKSLCCVEIKVEHLSGKCGREVLESRKK